MFYAEEFLVFLNFFKRLDTNPYTVTEPLSYRSFYKVLPRVGGLALEASLT